MDKVDRSELLQITVHELNKGVSSQAPPLSVGAQEYRVPRRIFEHLLGLLSRFPIGTLVEVSRPLEWGVWREDLPSQFRFLGRTSWNTLGALPGIERIEDCKTRPWCEVFWARACRQAVPIWLYYMTQGVTAGDPFPQGTLACAAAIPVFETPITEADAHSGR